MDYSSFLMDMTSLAKMDTNSMNRAIIQMSNKLRSNNLIEISEEEAKNQKELFAEIIYGSLDYHGIESDKNVLDNELE